ncbi:MAG: hypothetical protein ACYC1I_12685, partial [Acidimicrobiales bacterium]
LREHSDVARGGEDIREALESILSMTGWSVSQNRSFDQHHVMCGEYWLPRLGLWKTILDNGEEVITIFNDPVVVRSPGHIRHASTGAEVLPSPSELVNAFRTAWCDPDASVGRRPEVKAPRINRSTDWVSQQPDPDQDSQMQGLVAGDPVAAAQLAEELGFWSRASGYWLLAGDVAGALDVIPLGDPGASGGNSWSALSRVILALVLRRSLSAADLILLHDNRLTTWGRSHSDEVVKCLQSHIDVMSGTSEDVGRQLLRFEDLQWAYAWHSGIRVDGESQPVEMFWPWLGESELGAAYCGALVRQSENEARVNAGQHRVGEGWISETEMFNLINERFGQTTTIVQHGRPAGLGQQHLDVWIPEWKIGIEYQGLQHDQPVDFFGGEDAWLRTLERDERKRASCSELGITLIEVRPGFNAQDLISDIERYRPY